jgi:lysophospholipase L1-like esterase
MTHREGWKGTVGLLAGATLLAFVVVAFAGEAAVRRREWHRTTLAGTLPLLFYQHGRLGHAMVRGFDYFGWIHINHEGFRGPEVAVQKAPGVLRIMAVGSSTTFDRSVSGDAATWPARLQFSLNQLPGRSVEVINAGVPGYRVMEDLIRLEEELYRYQPDVIILYEGHNDLFGALGRGRGGLEPASSTPGEVPIVTPWGHWLSRHSLLYGKLAARLKVFQFGVAGRRTLAQGEPAGQSEDETLNAGAQKFERDLASFLAVASTLGTRVVIPEMVHASGVGTVSESDSTLRNIWSYTVPFARPEAVLRGYVRYNAVLQQVAKRFGATWIGTASFGLTGTQWYDAGDPIHFNDRGADRMGHRLAEALVASGILDLRAPQPPGKARAASAASVP